MSTFARPFNIARSRDLFGVREVGITHPDNNAYVKISDNGSIEIMGGTNFGIILDAKSRSINFYADTVNFHTKESGGLNWNRLSFNNRATKYTEPPLLPTLTDSIVGLFDGVIDLVGSGKTS